MVCFVNTAVQILRAGVLNREAQSSKAKLENESDSVISIIQKKIDTDMTAMKVWVSRVQDGRLKNRIDSVGLWGVEVPRG